jgi:hypothetical protein
VSISLDPEDLFYSWGCETATDKVGPMYYYFYLLASHNSRKGTRVLSAHLAGRFWDARQVTWAEKSLSKPSWRAFPLLTVIGNEYSDNGETVTPRLDVKVLQ